MVAAIAIMPVGIPYQFTFLGVRVVSLFQQGPGDNQHLGAHLDRENNKDPFLGIEKN